ncbi:hypothetical protein [uncultured Dokdonia sp.]|uniref:hypothetical protein n=1 Tax=uncultured Dokdonia sp. TaxID=575653 RepID=UPI002626354D|nr:hypothetical protein [uncultured Dokdonia sp.]
MDWNSFKMSTLTFVKHLPDTIKRTSIWLIISYLIPIINIGIIGGIRSELKADLSILSILLVTNACFITSLVFLIDKKRELTNVLNTITLVVSIVLFAFSIAQMELDTKIFPLSIYKSGAYITLVLSIFIGLVSKYDEVEANSLERATKGRNKKETTVGNTKVKL